MENLNSLTVGIHCGADAEYDTCAFRSQGKPMISLHLIRSNAAIYFHDELEIRRLIDALWTAAARLGAETQAMAAEARAIENERAIPAGEVDPRDEQEAEFDRVAALSPEAPINV